MLFAMKLFDNSSDNQRSMQIFRPIYDEGSLTYYSWCYTWLGLQMHSNDIAISS